VIRPHRTRLRTGLPPLVLAAILIGAAIALVAPGTIRALGVTTAPPAAAPAEIEAAVRNVIGNWQPALDPLITPENGRQVKSSNVEGVEVGGARYFYRPKYGFSADPVSRGVARDYEVVMVLEAGTQWETEVYRLR
jgi:hypothetical protein